MKNLDWDKLSFGYLKTDYNVRSYYKDGKWSDLEITDSEMIPVHMASTCLHYGQEAFEGLNQYGRLCDDESSVCGVIHGSCGESRGVE